jgi:carbon monoxide dehydrogenase subunit G
MDAFGRYLREWTWARCSPPLPELSKSCSWLPTRRHASQVLSFLLTVVWARRSCFVQTMFLQHKVAKPPAVVFEYLTNMLKFVSVHPVIHKMDRLNGDDYLVHETLKLGPFPISFTYPVTVNGSDDRRTVTIRAVAMRVVRIGMTFTLREIPTGTLVEEEVVFASLLPIEFIMERIFRKQHTRLFENVGNVGVDV